MSDFVYDKIAVRIRIREKRLALRLTQERGAVGMSIETLMSLCDVLKTTPNNLLLPGDRAEDDELQWAIEALTNASDHVRASAIDILRSYLRST